MAKGKATPATPATQATPATPATPAFATIKVVFSRYHTRGADAFVSFHAHPSRGIVYMRRTPFGETLPEAFTLTAYDGGDVPAGHTLLTLSGRVAQNTRGSYEAKGIDGTVIIHDTLFAPCAPPQAFTVDCVFVAKVRNNGKATSAVIASANVAQSAHTGSVAVPAAVAAVAAVAADAVVTAVSSAPSGDAIAKGKAAAAAVLSSGKSKRSA